MKQFASVQFARAHNIGISVFSTGHEFKIFKIFKQASVQFARAHNIGISVFSTFLCEDFFENFFSTFFLIQNLPPKQASVQQHRHFCFLNGAQVHLHLHLHSPESHQSSQASVQFARAHNIGISVFSTGHEFNDRGGGPGNNTLLVY